MTVGTSGAPAEPGVEVLGVRVHALDMTRTVDRVAAWIEAGETRRISLATAHGVMEARRSPALQRAFAAADLVAPDGMSMVWLLRLAGYRRADRVYGPDLMRELCRRSVEESWSHFLLGGEERINARLAERLVERFPGIRIAGRHAPPFRPLRPEESAALARRIDDSGARLVWVGLGTPKQDLWMAEHGRRLHRAVTIGVGAAFDFLSGHRRQAPRWIQRSGFEWLFRLALDSRRLAPRYSRYPLFVLLMLPRLPVLWRQRFRAPRS